MKPYRPCVGVVLLNKQNKIFLGKRISKTFIIEKPWQMPQGGIEKNEDPEAAAIRELYEETGVRSIKIINKIPYALSYDFPPTLKTKITKRYCGQTQLWFLANFLGDESEVQLDLDEPEFETYEWCETNEVIERVVEWKKKLYQEVLNTFNLI